MVTRLAGAAEPTFTRSDVHSSVYHLIGVDLRKVDELLRKLDECGIDRARPTAFIAECVLVYMPSEASSALVAAIATNFQTALFINYEQVLRLMVMTSFYCSSTNCFHVYCAYFV